MTHIYYYQCLSSLSEWDSSQPTVNQVGSTGIAILGVVLYSVVFLSTVLSMIFPPKLVEPCQRTRTIQRTFNGLVLLFCSLRVIWFVVELLGFNGFVAYGLNQLSTCIFFSTFSLIVVYWMEEFHRVYIPGKVLFPRFRTLFLVFNALFWLVGITLFVGVIEYGQFPGTNPYGIYVYQLSIINVIIMHLLLAIGFIIYGNGLIYQKVINAHQFDASARLEHIKIFIVMFFLSCNFILRVCFFMYRFIFIESNFNNIIFCIFGYFIPECTSVLLQVFTVYSLVNQTWMMKFHQTEEDDPFIIPEPYRQPTSQLNIPWVGNRKFPSLHLSKSHLPSSYEPSSLNYTTKPEDD